MILSRSHRTESSQRFATCRADSAHKALWHGCVSFWAPAMGVTGIATLYDLSGYANHGTFAGSMNGADWVQSPWGYALDFDASDDRITLSGSTASRLEVTSLTVHSAFSITGSVTSRSNITRAQAGGTVSGWGTGVSDSSANKLKFYTATSAGSGNLNDASTALTAGAWYTAAWTYFPHASATNKFIWVDGKVDGSTAWGGALGYTSCVSSIGRYEGGTSQYWAGKMATVGVWNRVLSPQEIQLLAVDPLAMVRRKKAYAIKTIPAVTTDLVFSCQRRYARGNVREAPPKTLEW